MHQLIALDDVNRLLREAQPFSGGNGLVTGVGGLARSILKFSSISVCEVLGYRLAEAVGVRVPRMQGFWSPSPVEVPRAGLFAEPGRIGILIEYLDDWMPLRRDHAARLDPFAVVHGLVLCVFDRYEWGEFGQSHGQVYFVDLERILPPVQPEILLSVPTKDHVGILAATEEPYFDGSLDMIRQVLEEAEELGLLTDVVRELEMLCSLRPETYSTFFALAGHPLDGLLSRFAASAFGGRLNALSERLGRPTHEVPTWR